jgi:putative phosphoesterase
LPRGSRRLPGGCIELIRRVDLVLHTGDVTTQEALAELEELGPPVRAVGGNMDEPGLRAVLPDRLVVECEGTRIGLVHDAGPREGRRERLRGWFPACDLLVYGHTHLPEVTQVGRVWVVNPGSPTERRRAPARTMAVLEGSRPRLVTLS